MKPFPEKLRLVILPTFVMTVLMCAYKLITSLL